MVKGLIAKVMLKVASSFGKSVFKAFQNVKSQNKQGGRAAPPPNPF